MQITLIRQKATIEPSLLRALRRAEDPRPALEAAGLVVISRAVRAFDDPGVRPAPWQALKASTLAGKAKAGKSEAILKRDGVLWRSIRMTSLTRRDVTVGTDRFYAHFHQLGTKSIPARPFFPFDARGRMDTPTAKRVESALRLKLRIV